jgi:glucose dehydrogenase
MTIFARKPADGAVVWAYQMTPHDEWDYDGVNENVLFESGGKKLLAHFDRNGFGYTIDRTNGKVLVAQPYGPVNWAKRVDLTTGVPEKDPRYGTTSKKNTEGICPAAIGFKDQQPAAYSPITGYFYVPANHICMDYEGVEVKYTAGQPYVGAIVRMFPGPGGHRGRFIAWDPMKGKVVWEAKEQLAAYGGALTTATGLVFYGTMEGWLKALDQKTGIPEKDPRYGTTSKKNTEGICPAAIGFKDQQPAAYSPVTGHFYVPANHICMDYEGVEVKYTAGQPYVGAIVRMFPGPGGHRGNFIAWDPMKGKAVWQNKENLAAYGGALTTAGGLVFYGTMEGWLKALDQKTGKTLWQYKTPSGIIGNPMTYNGPDGQQYVAVYSGIGGWAGIGVAAGIGAEDPTAGLGALGAFGDAGNFSNQGGVMTVFALKNPWAAGR